MHFRWLPGLRQQYKASYQWRLNQSLASYMLPRHDRQSLLQAASTGRKIISYASFVAVVVLTFSVTEILPGKTCRWMLFLLLLQTSRWRHTGRKLKSTRRLRRKRRSNWGRTRYEFRLHATLCISNFVHT